jgi:hypothetical protein
MNSFGNGNYHDGAVQQRIDEIDRELSVSSRSSEVKNGARFEECGAVDVVDGVTMTCRYERGHKTGHFYLHPDVEWAEAPQSSASPVTEPGGDVKEKKWCSRSSNGRCIAERMEGKECTAPKCLLAWPLDRQGNPEVPHE